MSYSLIKPSVALPYRDAVAQGLVPGASLVHKFGRNSTTANGAWETVWEASTLYTFQTAASAVEAISTDTDDTSGGTGAQTVTIEGLDETWAAASETVTMAGVAASSPTTTTFIRVFRAYVNTCGAYQGANEGTITIRDSGAGATRAVIAVDTTRGLGQTQQAFYTVPLGKQAFVCHWTVSVESAKSADFVFYQRLNADDAVTPFSPRRSITYLDGMAASASFHDEGPHGPFAAKTDLWWEVKASAANTEVTVDFELLVIDA
jgi:hypothetical protein